MDTEDASGRAADAVRSGRFRRFRVPGVLLLLAVLLATIPAFVGASEWRRVSALRNGVPAVGTVHAEGANCWRHRCWAEFEVDGRRVEADLPALTSARENKVRRDGSPIDIRYLASDPTVAAEEGSLANVVAMTAILGLPSLALLIAGLARLAGAVRSGRTPAQSA